MKRSKDKLERIEELVEMDNKTELNETELSYDEFMSFINSSLQKIYSYSSGFDITKDEFVEDGTTPELILGSEVILVDDNTNFQTDPNKIDRYTIIEVGQGLVGSGKNKQIKTIFTLEDSLGGTIKRSQDELEAQAVTLKSYYNKLAVVERNKTFYHLAGIIKKELLALEQTLDVAAVQQELAITAEMFTEAEPEDYDSGTSELSW